jgi:hypothetical protein
MPVPLMVVILTLDVLTLRSTVMMKILVLMTPVTKYLDVSMFPTYVKHKMLATLYIAALYLVVSPNL